jgi:SAM-dependent methyltransferase
VVFSSRNFYGVLRVKEYGTGGGSFHLRRLLHGVIMHWRAVHRGRAPAEPTTYYMRSSGIGAAIAAAGARGPVKVGVIGLGTGTLAAYGRKGDSYRFYDINPQVLEVARSFFSFLSDTQASVELVLGDARLYAGARSAARFRRAGDRRLLQRLDPGAPDHARGARVYLRHMKPNGVIAFHVSNRFLELPPVVGRLALEHGLAGDLVSDEGKEGDDDHTKTDWVLIARDANTLAAPQIAAASPVPPEERPNWRTWTDDYSNLVQILK